uniref:Protein krueppel n=1 Tax=Cuerna arida TaxID=1464854 RepID=A0A1B6GH52_9HEMI
MSGYRRVNYYELCRLCTASEGTKMHIFREEGRRRQLPSKIQLCLPLQVCEDDSLPKIICNQCVDKLESFCDFRASCVNAEAMLESYFTSLRYSEDFIREGKVRSFVYVKDDSPPKKKTSPELEKPSIKVPHVQSVPVASIPVSVDGLNNLVQATSIQIVSQPEQEEINRLPHYRGPLEMQPTTVAQAVVDTPAVRYSYQTCTSMAATNTTTNITLLKTEDSTQTDYQKELHKPEVVNQNHQTMDQGTTTYYVRVPNNVEHESSSGRNEETEAVEGETLHQAITFAPSHGQDMLVHFGFNKDNKDQNNTTTILRTDDRASIAQIGEFLRMKTVVVEEEPNPTNEQEHPCCDQCGKELNTPELQANHEMLCPGPPDDKNGGTFSCEVCGKPFKRKEHLFQHRKLHTGERPYACGTCGKAFSRKEHLVRHAVSHTGQKSHTCDMCSKSFSRKDNLHKHRKTHGIAGPYVCETCGKSFVVKHYYLMHKTSHSSPDSPDDPLPYRCDICYKGFSVKQYLTTHKLRHRSKNVMPVDGSSGEQPEQDMDQDPLSTVNPAAILPHHPDNPPLFQVATGTNTTTYLTTAATNQLIENYRRLHSS